MSKGDIKWWFEPGNGQKWGWMLPVDITVALQNAYGPQSPMSKFAEEVGVSPATVSRWCAGKVPMPKLPALYLTIRTGAATREVKLLTGAAKWLPECRSVNGSMKGNVTLKMLQTVADADRAASSAPAPQDDYDPDWAPRTDHTGLVLEQTP